MLARKCPKCNAVWYTALPKCAFCGVEGVEQASSTHTGRLPEKPVPAAQPAPAPVEAAVAVAEATPVPPTSAEAAKAVEEKPAPGPVSAAAEPAPVLEAKPAAAEIVVAPVPRPEPGLSRLSPGEERPDPSTLPPAPRVPSAKAPVIFALLGLAACALLPVVILLQLNRIADIMALLAVAILLPFAPLAWSLGRRYEDRCIDLGFRPAASGRTGRLLGMAVTFLLAAVASGLAVLTALRKM
jgi:hypothetical protein